MNTAHRMHRNGHVARLLDGDPSLVHARVRDLTPLQFAARRRNAGLVQLLLDHGANVNAHGGWKGWTPLHWAAHDGRAENVRLLLANGADVHARDDDGKTPGDIAAQRGHAEVAALLRARDASA